MGRPPNLSARRPVMDVVYERLHSYSLTQREEEIVRFLLEGLSNKEIANCCHITEQTVKDHLKHVYGKIGVHQRAALISELLKFPPSGDIRSRRL